MNTMHQQQDEMYTSSSSHSRESVGKDKQQAWVEHYHQQAHQILQQNTPIQQQQQQQYLDHQVLPHQIFKSIQQTQQVNQPNMQRDHQQQHLQQHIFLQQLLSSGSTIGSAQPQAVTFDPKERLHHASVFHSQPLQHGSEQMYHDEMSELNLVLQQQSRVRQSNANQQQLSFHLMQQQSGQQIQQENSRLFDRAGQTHPTTASGSINLSQSVHSIYNEGLDLPLNTMQTDDNTNDPRRNHLNATMQSSDLQHSINNTSTVDDSRHNVSLSMQSQRNQEQFVSQQMPMNNSKNLGPADSSRPRQLNRNVRGITKSLSSNMSSKNLQREEPNLTTLSPEERLFSVFTGSRKRSFSDQCISVQKPLPQQKRRSQSPASIRSYFKHITRIPPSRTASADSCSIGEESLLHNSCKLYPNTPQVVESALELDPDAIRRPVPLICIGRKSSSFILGSSSSIRYQRGNKEDDLDNSVARVSHHSRVDNAMDDSLSSSAGSIRSNQRVHDFKSEKYEYPINIALKCGAGLDVIELLAKAGPDVLLNRDGPDGGNSLGIALSLGYDDDTINKILSFNPKSAMIVDRHENTPLHTAVRIPTTSVDIVSCIYEAFPDAISYRNFNNDTPLEVAIRSPLCPEDVVNYLQEVSFSQQEMNNVADVQDLDSLEVLHP